MASEVSTKEETVVEPQAEELRDLQLELVNLNTKLVFAVATCDCEKKEHCELYQISKEVAKVLKEIQNVMGGRTKERKRRK